MVTREARTRCPLLFSETHRRLVLSVPLAVRSSLRLWCQIVVFLSCSALSSPGHSSYSMPYLHVSKGGTQWSHSPKWITCSNRRTSCLIIAQKVFWCDALSSLAASLCKQIRAEEGWRLRSVSSHLWHFGWEISLQSLYTPKPDYLCFLPILVFGCRQHHHIAIYKTVNVPSHN